MFSSVINNEQLIINNYLFFKKEKRGLTQRNDFFPIIGEAFRGQLLNE